MPTKGQRLNTLLELTQQEELLGTGSSVYTNLYKRADLAPWQNVVLQYCESVQSNDSIQLLHIHTTWSNLDSGWAWDNLPQHY